MEKEILTTNDSKDAVDKMRNKLNFNSTFRFLGFFLLFIAVFGVGIYAGFHIKQEKSFGHVMKFMKQNEELTVTQFASDPIGDRDWAWDSENVPNFIKSDFQKAALHGYDGVEYYFGANKIRVEEEFLSDNLEVIVNTDLGWSMSNFSIYSSGENIVIYGYWNDEFRRITIGKTEDTVIKEVLTLNPGVPFSANSKYITENAKKDYIFVISDDMKTVSAYKENARVGEAVVLPNEILGFYDSIMVLAKSDDYSDKLYMPYVVDNNGIEELVCIEIATVSVEEVVNVSDTKYMDAFQCYTTNYSAQIGYVCCYIFENEDGMIRMIVPNNISKYAAYRRGTGVLTLDDDLGWHWITITE